MDEVRAARFADELIGTEVAGWKIGGLLGSGKSALVLEARKDSTIAAVKVFDPELIERFGRAVQMSRIERELRLCGQSHPSLVRILDGGECPNTGRLFVAMEHLAAPNLGEVLQTLPRDRIWPTISQVANAARFLESLELAHRDIKPSNIAITTNFQQATLLDLGVIRPFGDPSLTDDEARTFVGTLRYSSPEFLFRREIDSRDGWRAIAFYQLGSVLHDLIMRKPLFQEFSDPYAVLVEAVKSERPIVYAEDVSPELISIANNCLLKDPDARLTLVSWDDFSPRQSEVDAAASARERLRKRGVIARLNGDETRRRDVADEEVERKEFLQDVRRQLENVIRFECTGNPIFPRMEFEAIEGSFLQLWVVFDASRTRGLTRRLHMLFECETVDLSAAAVSISCSAFLVPIQQVASRSRSGGPAIFRGALDRTLLQKRVSDSLYVLLDDAISREKHEDASTITQLSPALPAV